MEKLLFGLYVMVVGLCIVFFCLAMLIALFTLQSRIVGGMEKRKKEKALAKQPPVEEKPEEVVEEEPVDEEEDDEEEMAAAVAAVMMMLAQEGENVQGLRVRAVRRIGVNTPAWGRAHRGDFVSGL